VTLLADLVATSTRVTATSGRRDKAATIGAFLRSLEPDEVAIAVAWLAGETRQGRAGIGYAALRDARTGGAPSATLALRDVDAALAAIAATGGRGSAASRAAQLAALFARATPDEQAFLAHLLVGELRQGALEGLMIDAVAVAAGVRPEVVRRAAMVGGGIAAIAPAALREGEAGLARFALTTMRPVAPMLAQPADDLADALAALPERALEWKVDGARVQVHRDGADVRIFTRTGNDVTAAAPEIVEAVQALPVSPLILDGEAIALRDDGAPYPFQDTMRRFGRVQSVAAMRATLPLSVLFFDVLRAGGDDLLAAPASARFDALAAALPDALRIPRLVTQDDADAQAFHDRALALGHEGVMVKALDSAYAPGERSAAWRKVKRAHTLDLVVLAAEWGHGRRRGTLSNLHLGARNPADGTFVMLGKTFKGLTDELLAWQTRELLAREIGRDERAVHVRPELVVEVAFNDLQASPRYPAGLALRFARVKGYRPDKRAADADTIEAVRAIFAAQAAPHGR